MPNKERRDGTGSYFKTANGWIAQIRVYDEFTGKSKQIRRRAKNRDHARDLLKGLRDGVVGSPTASPGTTVAEWLDQWAEVSLPVSGVKESTRETYLNLIKTPLKPTLGGVHLDAFTPVEAERWLHRLDAFRGRPRTPRPTKKNPHPQPIPGRFLSQSTKRQAFAVLSLAMKVAVRDGMIQENPLAQVSRPRKARSEVAIMTADEVEQLLTAAENTHYESLIKFVAFTGVRIGEALSLRWADVNLESATATIRRGSLSDDSTKTAAGVRTIPLVPEVVDALESRKTMQAAERLKMGAGWADEEGLIFTSGSGTPVDDHNARRNLRAVLEAAGLPTDRPWHTMRHSLATRLLNRGVPMPVVSSILGHASIRTTVDIYGHAEPAISAQAMADVFAGKV